MDLTEGWYLIGWGMIDKSCKDESIDTSRAQSNGCMTIGYSIFKVSQCVQCTWSSTSAKIHDIISC